MRSATVTPNRCPASLFERAGLCLWTSVSQRAANCAASGALNSSNRVKSPSVPELDQDQVTRQEFGLVLRVTEVGSDSTTVELVYESLKMKFDAGDFKAEFDSTKPAAGPGKKPGAPAAKSPPPG